MAATRSPPQAKGDLRSPQTGLQRVAVVIIFAVMLALLLCCVLGILIGIVLRHCCSTNVRVLFADTDAKAPEDYSFIQATVLIKGAKDLQRKHNFILTVIPLTVGEYLQVADRYGNSCDSIIMASNTDPAEEKDFNRTRLKTIVAPGNTVHDELYFNVSLHDDSIEEPDEYFLLVLDVPQLDETVYDIDKKRQCMKLTIIADKDRCELLYEQTVMEVAEDAGEVELFRISKQGQTELPVTIYINGNNLSTTFMISSTTITLSPNETSALVSATIIDDPYPEDQLTYHIHLSSDHGNQTINITILDNDCPSSPELFPFGVGAGDFPGPTGDDSASSPITLGVPLTFFGMEYSRIFVNSNGVLSFETSFTSCCAPRTLPRSSPPLIAPYWHDFDPTIGGAIYYRQTNDSQQLQLFHTRLSLALNAAGGLSNFSPTLLFIATWDQVPQYSGSALVNNTLQVVLATDSVQTIAVFIYYNINWGAGAQIGFYAGDGYTSFMFPEALSNQTLNIDERSNVGEPGVFVYRIGVPPDLAHDLTVERTEATSISISWKPPIANSLRVQYYLINVNNIMNDDIIQVNTATNVTFYNVTGLLPGTTYELTVVAVYIDGGANVAMSQASSSVTGFTVCDELILPASGTIEYASNRSIGSTVSYLNFQCNMGFEQRGELVRRCSENGWEGQAPYCNLTTITAVAISVVATLVMAVVSAVGIYLLRNHYQKRRLTLYDAPYNYALPPLPPRIQRMDSGLYDTISERTVSESELNADLSSQEPVKDITLHSLTVTCDGSGIQESGVEENQTETGDTEANREVDEMNVSTSCEGVNVLENDATVETETGSTEVNREVDTIEENTSSEGEKMLENDDTVRTGSTEVNNEFKVEESPTCTGVRMQENVSYQPSTNFDFAINPAYETDIAIAPEIPTEDNIAYRYWHMCSDEVGSDIDPEEYTD